MLRYYGVTELTGKPGSGKTAISTEESKKYETVYITTTTFCIGRYEGTSAEIMDRILIKYISSIEYLAFFVTNELEVLIRARSVELVVVDSLDHLLATEERSSRLYSLIFRIVNRLKRINQKYLTNILIVTYYYGGWSIGSFCISNPLLGLGWMYMVNTRYLCRRDGERRTLTLVSSPMDGRNEWMFEIEQHGVSYFPPQHSD